MGYYGELHDHFVHWTKDGSHLVFDLDDTIWVLDIEGVQLRRVADTNASGYRSLYGFYGDVSPNGSRIVYSTCEHRYRQPLPPRISGGGFRYTEGYEIAVVDIDGSGRQRLTTNDRLDNYPAWSPDGTRIAFITHALRSVTLDPHHYPRGPDRQERVKLATMTVVGGSRVASTMRSTKRVALYPPVWSPDSEGLAFIALEGEEIYPYDHVVHSIRLDKRSEVNRIGKTTALPTWSPDSEELAFAAMDGEDAVVYAVRPDGTERRQVWSSGAAGASTPVSQVSWSPDGSEILFVSDEVYVVDSDGGGLRALSVLDGESARAAWSPDGSRIAVYYPRSKIIAMSRDGSDLQTLVTMSSSRGLPAAWPN